VQREQRVQDLGAGSSAVVSQVGYLSSLE
jgi:hypothetical protein